MTPANENVVQTFTGTGQASAHKVNTLIVVPCYNEEKRLDPDAFLKFVAKNRDIGFVFVDDGSKDQTLSVLTSMRMHCPQQVHVMTLAKNSGKAEAVRMGMNYAARQNVAMLGYWDADLATPLNAITDFTTVMNRYDDLDVIYGARRTLMGHRVNRTLVRKTISTICATLARFAIALPVSDTQCGAKLFRNTIALRTAIAAKFKTGWLFDIELFSRLSRLVSSPRTSFYEFPLSEWEEVEGSNITTKAVMRAGVSIIGLIARTRILGEQPELHPANDNNNPSAFRVIEPVIAVNDNQRQKAA